MRVFFFCVLFLFSTFSKSQTSEKKAATMAVVLTSENDNYVSAKDRYYTNGMRIGISFLSRRLLTIKSDKTIIRFHVAQEIYTPSNTGSRNVVHFDRPYAGYLHLEMATQMYWREKNSLMFATDIGVIGPAAGGDRIQSWWHKVINYPEAEGWEYQIRNELAATIKIEYARGFLPARWTDITAISGIRGGTAFNSISQDCIVRVGKITPIGHSSLTNSRLAYDRPKNSVVEKEFYIFYQLGGVYVLHNALVEGSLLNTVSYYTEKAVPFISRQTAGIAYSGDASGIKIFLCMLSPEVSGGHDHYYGGIELTFGF